MATALELLQQIASNTSTDESINIALISAGAALFGATIGAVVSYLGLRISRDIEMRKLKAGLIATERLRWLQDIRERFSSFYGGMDIQFNLLKRPVTAGPEAFQEILDGYSKSIAEQCNRITLMLNPAKKRQAELRQALSDAQLFFLKCISVKTLAAADFDDDAYAAIRKRAFNAITDIGIETWRQVKELE